MGCYNDHRGYTGNLFFLNYVMYRGFDMSKEGERRYTGERDSKGQMIYYGDVIKYTDKDDYYKEHNEHVYAHSIGVIKFSASDGVYAVYDTMEDTYYTIQLKYINTYRNDSNILGNMWDTPELLENNHGA